LTLHSERISRTDRRGICRSSRCSSFLVVASAGLYGRASRACANASACWPLLVSNSLNLEPSPAAQAVVVLQTIRALRCSAAGARANRPSIGPPALFKGISRSGIPGDGSYRPGNSFGDCSSAKEDRIRKAGNKERECVVLFLSSCVPYILDYCIRLNSNSSGSLRGSIIACPGGPANNWDPLLDS
jgi:hypothetical protein